MGVLQALRQVDLSLSFSRLLIKAFPKRRLSSPKLPRWIPKGRNKRSIWTGLPIELVNLIFELTAEAFPKTAGRALCLVSHPTRLVALKHIYGTIFCRYSSAFEALLSAVNTRHTNRCTLLARREDSTTSLFLDYPSDVGKTGNPYRFPLTNQVIARFTKLRHLALRWEDAYNLLMHECQVSFQGYPDVVMTILPGQTPWPSSDSSWLRVSRTWGEVVTHLHLTDLHNHTLLDIPSYSRVLPRLRQITILVHPSDSPDDICDFLARFGEVSMRALEDILLVLDFEDTDASRVWSLQKAYLKLRDPRIGLVVAHLSCVSGWKERGCNESKDVEESGIWTKEWCKDERWTYVGTVSSVRRVNY